MFELITQIIILIGIYYLARYVLLPIIDPKYVTWFVGIVLVLLGILAILNPTNNTVGIVWSILSFPLRPLGLSLVLLAYALRAGTKSVSGPQVLAAFLILLISSLPLTAYLLTAQTEQRSVIEAVRRQEASSPKAVQAIVVLGDGAVLSQRIRTQVSDPREPLSITLQSRLLYGANLYRNRSRVGNTPLMIVNVGPVGVTNPQDSVVNQAVTNLLVGNGIPQNLIRIDNTGIDPRSSAIAVRKFFGGSGVAANCTAYVVCDNGTQQIQSPTAIGTKIPIVLVAPSISIRRASSTFNHLNFEVSPRPTDFYVFQIEQGFELATLSDLLPNAEALAVTCRVIDEYLATVYYFLRGWLADPLGV
jgi:hypothetical protein